MPSLVGSEMCIRDSINAEYMGSKVVTLKKKSPHVLRHTFATAMLNNEANLNAIKELLGHASLAATEVYTHTTFEELKNIYKLAHPRAQKRRYVWKSEFNQFTSMLQNNQKLSSKRKL
eukprot:TRINITY_DN13036_c0_g1_i1.p2 TRINITY_DN13036_c0_g1~~TRINITY_DN13036_c0_g1_i1.p2  ORF type:complete len:118 (-),score=19.10 TRINITY_DN13036_c0_g1_i1:365-718(-)